MIGLDNETVDASDRPGNTDRARQEFKDEADINYMLSRFGITQPRGTPTYGVWDDTLDLQQAIGAVRDARAGYKRLPEEIRNKFRSMEELLTAVENGSFEIRDEEAPPPVKTSEELTLERLEKAETELAALRARA